MYLELLNFDNYAVHSVFFICKIFKFRSRDDFKDERGLEVFSYQNSRRNVVYTTKLKFPHVFSVITRKLR